MYSILFDLRMAIKSLPLQSRRIDLKWRSI